MQAIIYQILPFDATVGATIKFKWDGNQVFKNRCIIRNNDTNEVVYDNTVESFKLEHVIDLSLATLINGQSYVAYITVFDQSGAESDIQPMGSQFLCLTTPIFRFSNVTDGQTISASSYAFALEYAQVDGELLDSWSIKVYTKSGTELATSGLKYDTSALSYTISGFDNNAEYIVRGTGETVNGIIVDTGDINITVYFQQTGIFSTLEPINVRERGAIYLTSNVVSAEGSTTNEPVFIDNEYIDLTDDALVYDSGFEFDDDFSLVLKFYGMNPNDVVLRLYDADGTYQATVTYRITKVTENDVVVTKSYFELMITSGGLDSVYYSNKLDLIDSTDIIGVALLRQNGLYAIVIHNYTDEEVIA